MCGLIDVVYAYKANEEFIFVRYSLALALDMLWNGRERCVFMNMDHFVHKNMGLL